MHRVHWSLAKDWKLILFHVFLLSSLPIAGSEFLSLFWAARQHHFFLWNDNGMNSMGVKEMTKFCKQNCLKWPRKDGIKLRHYLTPEAYSFYQRTDLKAPTKNSKLERMVLRHGSSSHWGKSMSGLYHLRFKRGVYITECFSVQNKVLNIENQEFGMLISHLMNDGECRTVQQQGSV